MQSELSLLVAEDDPNDAFFLRRAFEVAGVTASLHFVSDARILLRHLWTRGFAPGGGVSPPGFDLPSSASCKGSSVRSAGQDARLYGRRDACRYNLK